MSENNFLGIYGGTFDPIHLGHLSAAKEVAESLAMSEVRMLVSATPPHRQQPALSAQQRFDLLSLALKGQNLLVADDSEMIRSGYSYMVDSLAWYKKQQVKQSLALILGIDAFNGLKSWHQWQDIIKLAHIVVTDRADSDTEIAKELVSFVDKYRVYEKNKLRQVPSGLLYIQKVTPKAISSTKIKETIAASGSLEGLVPASVAETIRVNNFYKPNN